MTLAGLIPGNSLCGTPIVEITRPLTKIANAQFSSLRGFSRRLDPPSEDIGTGHLVQIFDTGTGNTCVVGELLCVTLGIEVEGNDGSDTGLVDAFVYPSVRAHLRWGLGAATFRARCDWRRGTQLSICGETMTVFAEYRKNSLPWAPVPEPDAPIFEVSAGVGYGNVGRNSNPATLTELVQILTPQSTQRIQIPPFATSFNVFPVNGGSGSARVFGFGSSYFVEYAIPAPPNPYSVENAFPLFNGARFLEIMNTESVEPFMAFVVFGLAL